MADGRSDNFGVSAEGEQALKDFADIGRHAAGIQYTADESTPPGAVYCEKHYRALQTRYFENMSPARSMFHGLLSRGKSTRGAVDGGEDGPHQT